jgi:hypothetical protein
MRELVCVVGAVVAASSVTFASLCPFQPYAWRAWLWGSIGFLLANTLLLAILLPVLARSGIASGKAPANYTIGTLLGIAVVLGPIAASVCGTVGGIFIGCYLARRKITRRAINQL